MTVLKFFPIIPILTQKAGNLHEHIASQTTLATQ